VIRLLTIETHINQSIGGPEKIIVNGGVLCCLPKGKRRTSLALRICIAGQSLPGLPLANASLSVILRMNSFGSLLAEIPRLDPQAEPDTEIQRFNLGVPVKYLLLWHMHMQRSEQLRLKHFLYVVIVSVCDPPGVFVARLLLRQRTVRPAPSVL
jgi:hypothetical protein